MAGQKEEDVDTLKRRGRRRLVGAVALVLLAVIVLPMVFDPEPRKTAPPVSVRIPGEEESPFTPKVTPRPPEKVAPRPPEKAEEKKPEAQKPVEEKKPPQEKSVAEPKKAPEPGSAQAERARAEAALSNAEYFVPVGAYANPDAVIAKLAEAKVKHYTEKVPTAKGPITRVRAGPFATKAQAEKAVEALKGLGLKPGAIATKS